MTIYAWTIKKPGRKDIQQVTTLAELCDYLKVRLSGLKCGIGTLKLLALRVARPIRVVLHYSERIGLAGCLAQSSALALRYRSRRWLVA